MRDCLINTWVLLEVSINQQVLVDAGGFHSPGEGGREGGSQAGVFKPFLPDNRDVLAEDWRCWGLDKQTFCFAS